MTKRTYILMAIATAAVVLAAAVPALAQGVEGHPIVPPNGGGTSSGGSLDGWGGLVLSLLVVVGLLLLARWLIRRSGTAMLPRSGGAVEVLHRSAISMKQQMLLVRLGRRVLLVGVTPQGMNTLAELTDPAEIGEVTAAIEKSRGEGFAGLLRSKSAQMQQAISAPGGGEVRKLADKLRQQDEKDQKKA